MSKEYNDINSQANDPAKFFKLGGLIFFSFIVFLLSLLILFFLMRLIFNFLPYISWIQYVYMVALISVAPSLFIIIYTIYFRRSKFYKPKIIGTISRVLFVLLILSWIFIFVKDILQFISEQNVNMSDYLGLSLFVLAGNVGFIFFTGIIQALAAPKKEEWSDKLMKNNL
ncbi:MAG: hypothetical protein JSR00_02465 [Bacteroidetes bacterium]|nr:hypothetical protein [Bacteroidota bacterium]